MMLLKFLKSMQRTVFIGFLTALCCICLPGCSLVKEIPQEDPFRILYDQLEAMPKSNDIQSDSMPLLTFSAYQMPLALFSRVISDSFGIGVVFGDDLAAKTITAEFKDTDLSTVLTVVSRQIGVSVVKIGNTYFLGQLSESDRGILVRRILNYDTADLRSAVSSMLSGSGKYQVLANNVVLISDNDFVLRRVSEAIDYMEGISSDCWIIQLYFVNLRKDALLDAGFEVQSSGKISYNISNSEVSAEDLKLDGFFNALMNSSYADMYASPMFIMRDNKVGKWQDGQRVPVPRKTVSDYGTVTTVGFDYVQTGVEVSASVRESSIGGVLALDISLSDISSYVEYCPVVSQSACNVEVDMLSDRLYLLGELQKYTDLDTQKNTLQFGASRGRVVLQVWGKIYKIAGAAKASPPLLN